MTAMNSAWTRAGAVLAPSSAPPPQRTKLLVVDDDPAFRRLCREFLRFDRQALYEITEAGSAAEALQLCGHDSFDGILIDYNLPDATGAELCELLRPVCGPLTPLLILTGVGSEALAIEAMHSGAADYIPKDRVSERSLGRAIGNAIERSRLLHSLEDRNQQLERANSELKKHHDQIQRFYHSVSHEIKTPLTAAREFVALVADGVFGPVSAGQREALGDAMESCDQIAVQFNELLECVRLDTGKLRLQREPARIERLISQSLASVRATVTLKALHLHETIEPNLPPIEVDAPRIVQVLANLFSNAVKFTANGGRIVVFTHRSKDGDAVVVEVRDSGCGIAPHELPRIFDRLYQASQGDSLSTQGLGLGLSIAREIVALHGGQLTADSQLGQGSVFRLILPLASGNAEARTGIPIADAPP